MGSFYSGSGAMSVKGLRALTRLVFAGAKHHTRRQDRLAVCGPLARRCRLLVCFSAAPFWCGQGLGGVVFIAAVVLCLPKGCEGSSNVLLEQQ